MSHQDFDITFPLESGLYVRDYTLAWISHSRESMHHVRQIHPGVYETLHTYGTVIRQKTIPLGRIRCVTESVDHEPGTHDTSTRWLKIYDDQDGEAWAVLRSNDPGYTRALDVLDSALGPRAVLLSLKEEGYSTTLLWLFPPVEPYPRLRLARDFRSKIPILRNSANAIWEKGFTAWPGIPFENVERHPSVLVPWNTTEQGLVDQGLARRNDEGILVTLCPVRVLGVIMEAGATCELNGYRQAKPHGIQGFSLRNNQVKDVADFCLKAAPGFKRSSFNNQDTAFMPHNPHGLLWLCGTRHATWPFTGLWSFTVQLPLMAEPDPPYERTGPQMEDDADLLRLPYYPFQLESNAFSTFILEPSDEGVCRMAASGHGIMWRNNTAGELCFAVPQKRGENRVETLIVPLGMIAEFRIERAVPAKGSGYSSLEAVLAGSGETRSLLLGGNTHDFDAFAPALADFTGKRVVFAACTSDA